MKKRLLLITPKFYDIEKSLISILIAMNFDVVWFENKDLPFDYHGTKSKMKFIRKLYFFLLFPRLRYIKKRLKEIDNSKFDILISINCHIIGSYLFRILKKRNPTLFSILYLWDSMKMYSWMKLTRFFNKVYTFDHDDSETFGWEYHPNFFIDNDSDIDKNNEHDIFFVGKFSPERFYVLNSIIEQISDSDYYFKVIPLYKNSLHNSWLYFFLKYLKFRSQWIERYILNYEAYEGIMNSNYIIHNRINYKDVQKEFACSNVVLDIPFSEQTGYSHRLIEALASGKKIITTNSHIKKESFFNPDQIRIIDENNPIVDSSWIKRVMNFQRNSNFDNQELSSWIKSILNVEIA